MRCDRCGPVHDDAVLFMAEPSSDADDILITNGMVGHIVNRHAVKS